VKTLAFLKRIPFSWMMAGLVILYLVPIWAFRYIPTQDGPSHLYNAYVIREFSNPAYDFEQYYTLRAGAMSNLAAYWILAGLMFAFQPLIAEKILASAYVLLFVFSMLYLQEAVRPGRNKIGVLMGMFLIYSYPFLMGFYSFALAVPLFALAIGYWWKHREHLRWGAVTILNVLLFAAFFAHVLPYFCAVCSILFLAAILYLKRPRTLLWSTACVVPSLLLFVYWIRSVSNPTAGPIGPNWSGVLQRLWEFASMSVTVSYDGNQQKLAYASFVLLLALVAYTLRERIGAARRQGSRSLEPSDCIGLLFLALFAVYLVAPWGIGWFGWVNDRLLILALVVLLAWVGDIPDKTWARVFGAMVVGLLLVNLLVLEQNFRRLNMALKEFTAGVSAVGPNEVLLPVISDLFGDSSKVGIFVNAANYYALGNGNVNIADYEAYFDAFPVAIRKDFTVPVNSKDRLLRIRGEPQLLDFCALASQVQLVLVWQKGGGDVPLSLARCYRRFFGDANSDLMLYRAP
jgi:hypothetical protein